MNGESVNKQISYCNKIVILRSRWHAGRRLQGRKGKIAGCKRGRTRRKVKKERSKEQRETVDISHPLVTRRSNRRSKREAEER